MNSTEISEEFNNFMYRVSEVQEIVKKLSSSDKSMQSIGMKEADQLLNEKKSKEVEDMNIEDIKVKVRSSRTVVNKNALKDNTEKDEGTMTQEAFVKEVSRDAENRFRDKCVRTEKMETFKRQATKAFRREEYEKALSCYNKAIEQIRDSPLLYNNRCITYINLKLYEAAIEDANTALKLNENCLRSYLLLAKAHLLNGKQSEYDLAMKEAKKVSPVDLDFIQDFHIKLTMSVDEYTPDVSEKDKSTSDSASVEVTTIKTIESAANFEYALSSEESTDSENVVTHKSAVRHVKKKTGKKKSNTVLK